MCGSVLSSIFIFTHPLGGEKQKTNTPHNTVKAPTALEYTERPATQLDLQHGSTVGQSEGRGRNTRHKVYTPFAALSWAHRWSKYSLWGDTVGRSLLRGCIYNLADDEGGLVETHEFF